MTKEEILHLANNLFEEALDAKCYFQIIQQFEKTTDEYNEEVNCSPAFYNVTLQALIQSMFMNLCKLYDWDEKSLTLRTLLKHLNDLELRDISPNTSEICGFWNQKFQRQLRPVEETLFPKEVQEQKDILAIFGYEYTYTRVDLTLQEMNDLFQRRFAALQEKGIVRNLINRRRKMLAHNDKQTNFDYARIAKENPLPVEEIRLLIEFAIDCLQFYIEILSGTFKAANYSNIDDWENTLYYVRIGKMYHEAYMKERYGQE